MTKDLSFQTGKITPEPRDGSWAAAFEFAPPSQSEKASRGVMLATVSISASPKFDSQLAGRQVLSALQESYYSQTTGGILPALERAVAAAHQRLVTLVFSGGGEESIDFNLVVGVLWGSVFYLAQLGEARAVIRRGGELKLIGHRAESNDELTAGEKPDIRVASGLLEVGDKIILGTPKFFDLIPAPELGQIVESGGADYIADKLTPRASDPAAAALVMALGVEGTAVVEDIATVPEEAIASAPIAAAIPPTTPNLEQDFPSPPPAPEEGSEASEPSPSEVEVITPDQSLTDPAAMPSYEPRPQQGELSAMVDRDMKNLSRGAGGFFAGLLSTLAAIPGALFGFIRRGILPGLGALLSKLWQMLGSPRTAVDGAGDARNRRTLFVLGGVLLLILIGSVVIGNLTRGDPEKTNRFNSLLASAQASYDEASSVATLERERAQQLLASSLADLNQADSLDIDDQKVNDLKAKVGTLQEEILSVYKVDPEVFSDISSIRAGAAGVDMTGTKDTLYVLDPTGGLYQITTSTRAATTLSSDLALNKGQQIILIGTNLFSLVQGQGIYGYDLKTKKLSQALKQDAAWGTIADLAGYTASAYLLDSAKSQILKYTPTAANRFGTSSVWTKDQTSLQAGAGISVDGSIWIGGGTEVLKFGKGLKETFLVQGVEPPLSAVRALFVTTDTQSIYILESGRVVVIDKTGQFVDQYQSDKFDQATSIIVDEAGKKAYILADKTVYLLELR